MNVIAVAVVAIAKTIHIFICLMEHSFLFEYALNVILYLQGVKKPLTCKGKFVMIARYENRLQDRRK